MLMHCKAGPSVTPTRGLSDRERIIMVFALEMYANHRGQEGAIYADTKQQEFAKVAEQDCVLAARLRSEVLDGESLRDIVLRGRTG